MAFGFDDKHATSLLSPQLSPGERVLFRTRGVEKPWYAKVLSRFGSMFWRNYVVAATDQRLLFVQYGGMFGRFAPKKVESIAWREVDQAKLGWGVFNKNLSVKSGARGFSKTVVLGRFWLKDNFSSAEGLVQTWTQARGNTLPPTPFAGALPSHAN